MGLPIVLIHEGDSSYLKYSIAQAQSWNPHSPIYFIGDRSTAYLRHVEHHLLSDYLAATAPFTAVYQHLSSNGEAYELFCFTRWFVLFEFMKAHKLPRCFYMDSDVMLYTDVSSEADRLHQYEMALIGSRHHAPPREQYTLEATSAHSCYLTLDALQQFCELTLALYAQPEQLAMLKTGYERYRELQKPGGVCDMVAWGEFSRCCSLPIKDLGVEENGGIYDDNINTTAGYRLPRTNTSLARVVRQYNKRTFALRQKFGQPPALWYSGLTPRLIEWRNGQPYSQRVASGEWVRFHVLHCQGMAKDLMSSLISPPR